MSYPSSVTALSGTTASSTHQAFVSRVLQLVHSTHLGETFSKSVARSSVWWPGIDEDVRNTVRQCVACQLAASSPPRTYISPWPAPNSAWERIHLDYTGPVDGKNDLLAVDAFSGWLVIKLVPNLSATTLIIHVRYMFAEYGLPEVILSDNGRQSASTESENFLELNGVKHLFSPP